MTIKMAINFELLNVVSKTSSLGIYISPVIERIETLNLDDRVNLIQNVPLDTLPQKELT